MVTSIPRIFYKIISVFPCLKINTTVKDLVPVIVDEHVQVEIVFICKHRKTSTYQTIFWAMHKPGQSDTHRAAGVEPVLYYLYLVLIVIHDIGDLFVSQG